jgi:hypothetical protein
MTLPYNSFPIHCHSSNHSKQYKLLINKYVNIYSMFDGLNMLSQCSASPRSKQYGPTHLPDYTVPQPRTPQYGLEILFLRLSGWQVLHPYLYYVSSIRQSSTRKVTAFEHLFKIHATLDITKTGLCTDHSSIPKERMLFVSSPRAFCFSFHNNEHTMPFVLHFVRSHN